MHWRPGVRLCRDVGLYRGQLPRILRGARDAGTNRRVKEAEAPLPPDRALVMVRLAAYVGGGQRQEAGGGACGAGGGSKGDGGSFQRGRGSPQMALASFPDASIAEECAKAAADAREAANELALKQTAASRQESAQFALQQQLLQAEQELVKAKDAHRAQQARLDELHNALNSKSAADSDANGRDQQLQGDALLEALQTAIGWKPISLTSTAMTLGFGEPSQFELRATMMPAPASTHDDGKPAGAASDPEAHTIHHVDLVYTAGVTGGASASTTPGRKTKEGGEDQSPSDTLRQVLLMGCSRT